MNLAMTASASLFPSEAEIRQILVERIDRQQQGVGMVIGTFGPAGRHVVSYGRFSTFHMRPVDGDTVFEIGSITKVFTTLLLGEMVGRGEVALDDPLAKYLPDTVAVPARDGRQITLTDLATHTSGLPRLPDNFAPEDEENPYADYSVEQMYDFLSAYELPRDIGSQYEYSNLGMGLLGHALARAAGMEFATLLHERVLAPLRMTSTAIDATPEMQARLALGHDADLMPVANWDLPTLAGAGALKSTVNDLFKLIEMVLDGRPSPLAKALETTLSVRRPTDDPGSETALGWLVSGDGDSQAILHDGGTGGYRSFLAIMPAKRIGIIGLSNTATEIGINDICAHLLDRDNPLVPAPRKRVVAEIDPNLYDRYVGTYRLAPTFEIAITREAKGLFAQATDQGRHEIFPENDKQFFLKVVDAQISFDIGADGRATGLTLHQNGRNTPGPRV